MSEYTAEDLARAWNEACDWLASRNWGEMNQKVYAEALAKAWNANPYRATDNQPSPEQPTPEPWRVRMQRKRAATTHHTNDCDLLIRHRACSCPFGEADPYQRSADA